MWCTPGQARAIDGDLDCKDFGTQEAAEHYLNQHPADIDDLDANNDGDACERNPSADTYGIVGSYIAGFAGVIWWTRRNVGHGKWTSGDYENVFAGTLLMGIPGAAVVVSIHKYLPRETTAIEFAGIGAAISLAAVWLWSLRHKPPRRVPPAPTAAS